MRRENRNYQDISPISDWVEFLLILLPGVNELSTWAHIYLIYICAYIYITYIYIIYVLISHTACIHSSSPQTARTNLAVVHAVLSQSLFLSLFSNSLSLCLFLSCSQYLLRSVFHSFPLIYALFHFFSPREITCQNTLLFPRLGRARLRNPESMHHSSPSPVIYVYVSPIDELRTLPLRGEIRPSRLCCLCKVHIYIYSHREALFEYSSDVKQDVEIDPCVSTSW